MQNYQTNLHSNPLHSPFHVSSVNIFKHFKCRSDYIYISFLISVKSNYQTHLHCNPLLSPFYFSYVLNISNVEVKFKVQINLLVCLFLLGYLCVTQGLQCVLTFSVLASFIGKRKNSVTQIHKSSLAFVTFSESMNVSAAEKSNLLCQV